MTYYKLGKQKAKFDSRTLQLGRYLTALPNPPAALSWTKNVTSFGSMLNTDLGCCTISAVGHAVQVWTENLGKEITVADSVIENYYEKWDGYNPADPSTDQGGIELDVLKKWQGSDFDSHKLDAFASVSPSNLTHIKQSIQLFGGVYMGVELPLSAQNQKVWDVAPWWSWTSSDPGSWGGHAMWVPAFNVKGPIGITWGMLKQMTWRFWNKYVSESYALLSKDWLNAQSIAPNKFNLAQLEQDLAALKA